MRKFASVVIGVAVISFGAMGSVTAAAATTSGTGGAQDAINQLQADGYAVQLNGSTGPLSQCAVTGVHGMPNDPLIEGQPIVLTTVYVDVDCMTND